MKSAKLNYESQGWKLFYLFVTVNLFALPFPLRGRSRSEFVRIWTWRETVNRDRVSIHWMTGLQQTLKHSNKRPQSASPTTLLFTPSQKKKRIPLCNPPTISLINWFPVKRVKGMGRITWCRGLFTKTRVERGRNRLWRKKVRKGVKKEEAKQLFPPTHSQLKCFQSLCCWPPSPWKRLLKQKQQGVGGWRNGSGSRNSFTSVHLFVHFMKTTRLKL